MNMILHMRQALALTPDNLAVRTALVEALLDRARALVEAVGRH